MIKKGIIPGSSASESPMTSENMPETIKRIRDEAQSFKKQSEERTRISSEWLQQVERIRQSVPSAVVEDDGETVRLGDLSPGCVACKNGRWDCIFVTLQCNLDCAFCLVLRNLSLQSMYSALGSDLDMLCNMYSRTDISGVSFSGGEPFLDPELVIEWLSVLRREFPELYIWSYTNGLTLSTPLLKRLAEAGLNEIRFNLAATGYHHSYSNRMLYEAVDLIPIVTVEVPAIPVHRNLILNSLHAWAQSGVKHLNLHELIYETGSNSESLDGERVACVMPDGHQCAVNPNSSELIRNVLERVADNNLKLAVNDCSLLSKVRQMRGRRQMLAPFVIRPNEQLREDGLAECIGLFKADHVEFIHPASLRERLPLGEGWRIALMRRQLPLNLKHHGQWVYFELITEDSV